MNIGFSEYEARAYIALLGDHPATPYQVARASRIPTSKIYQVLSRLEEKEMASALGEGRRKKYIPVPPGEFAESFEYKVRGTLGLLREELRGVSREAGASYIWDIKDYGHLMEKAGRMALAARESLLVSLWPSEMERLAGALKEAEARGAALAVVHFGVPGCQAGQMFRHPSEHTLHRERGCRGLAVVADSREALTASILDDGGVEGAWSTNRGLVTLCEDYIRHDIFVMKVVRRFDRDLMERFGRDYEMLRDVFRDEERPPATPDAP
ncbi:MAG: helix-turn-helix domain-containing protein [Thermodesulfovibrionales bacterium]